MLKQQLWDIEIQISRLQKGGRSYAHSTEVNKDEETPNKETPKTGVAKVMDMCMVELNLTQPDHNSWYIDSRASQHVTGNPELLHYISSKRKSNSIKTMPGELLSISRKGDVYFYLGGEIKQVPKVLYVSCVKNYICLIEIFIDKGHYIAFNSKSKWCIIFYKKNPCNIYLHSKNKLYKVVTSKAQLAEYSEQQHLPTI